MENAIKSKLKNSSSAGLNANKNTFIPFIYDMSKEDDRTKLEVFLDKNNSQLNVYNSIENQILELYKIDNPKLKPNPNSLKNYWSEWCAQQDPDYYGVWVYYPWSNSLVHLVPKADFIRLRTSRNQYKIHPEEQDSLMNKKVGVIGLSVGQSVALTLSMERVYGTLRIADFDHLDLSNLNRIRAGVAELGLPKTTIVAREIAEIDPFLKVEVFEEGITEDNLDEFLGEGEDQLDLLIEECDSLAIKIKARVKAREKEIPVIMDTSDRGMMDIERFDLEPDRALMHGMVSEEGAKSIDQWTAKERLALVMDMVGAQNISSRLKASLLEVEESLTTWPQLASSVSMGGALSTIVSRYILLGKPVQSGRFYLDADEMYLEPQKEESASLLSSSPEELSFDYCSQLLERSGVEASADAVALTAEEVKDLVENACLAPTGGNVQPWKWIWKDSMLALCHDKHFSVSFLDYRHRGSYIGLGAAMENLEQRALAMGYQAQELYRMDTFGADLVAVYSFSKILSPQAPFQEFGDRLDIRMTNRLKAPEYKVIPEAVKSEIGLALADSSFAMNWLEDRDKIEELAEIIGKVERQRILDPWGHRDFIHEARWTKEQAEESRNGVDLRTLELSEADKVGFKLIQDAEAMANLREWDKGTALIKMSTDAMKNCSALAILHSPKHDAATVLEGGKWVERIWLYLNDQGISYQPVSPATFMFARLSGDDISTSPYLREKLKELRKAYLDLLGLGEDVNDLFLCRLFYAKEPSIKSMRKPITEVFKNLMENRA